MKTSFSSLNRMRMYMYCCGMCMAFRMPRPDVFSFFKAQLCAA